MRNVVFLVFFVACTSSTPKESNPPVDPLSDQDGDGFTVAEGDCNDQEADVSPVATETCDALDNNCDGQIDEGSLGTFYADVDGDGFGDASSTVEDCVAPEGYVSIANDCNDTNALSYSGAPELCNEQDDNCDGQVDEGVTITVWADRDGDGFGDRSQPLELCSVVGGYADNSDDCDDLVGLTYPGAPEVCDNRDNDCNGTPDDGAVDAPLWYYDADGDRYGNCAASVSACSAPSGYVAAPTPEDCDCNDGQSAAFPGSTELCNGMDDDCDGITDEADASDAVDWYLDADGDGYGDAQNLAHACAAAGHVLNSADCDDTSSAINPLQSETCNFVDDNCNGTIDEGGANAPTWYADADVDGYGESSSSTVACNQPAGYVADMTDCDDGENTIFPGATELCDAVDQDCDGTLDNAFTDTDGDQVADCVDVCPVWVDASFSGGDGDENRPYTTINEGIQLRGDYCDEVIVKGGTYTETIVIGGDDPAGPFDSRDVVLQSEYQYLYGEYTSFADTNGDYFPDAVNCSVAPPNTSGYEVIVTPDPFASVGPGLLITGAQTRATVVSGLTFWGGFGTDDWALPGYEVGGGVLVWYSSPTLNQLVVQCNSVNAWGGGVYTYGSDLKFSDSIVQSNESGRNGGGVSLDGPHPELEHLVVLDNYTDGTGGGAVSQLEQQCPGLCELV